MKSHIRKSQILEAAYKLSNITAGWIDLTRDAVAEEAKCSNGLINKYFGTIDKLKNNVIELSIIRNNLCIIEQGKICGNKIARKYKKQCVI